LYGIGLQLNNLVRGLLTAALNAMTPATISLHAAGNPEHLRKLFRLSTKFFVAVGAVLWVSFYFLGETFLTLWLRRDVSPLVDALPWLMAASAVGVAAMPASVIALALGRLRLPALSGLLLAAGMVGCMTVLRSATGAPVLTEVCAMLAGFFGLYQIVRIIDVARALNFSMGELSGLCFRALAPAGLSAVLLIAASFFWPRASWERLVVTGALALVAGAGGACWFLFSDAERSLLVRFRSAVAAVAPSKG
jgi:O-antigen/teichoic acid export membrane protein